MAGFGSKLRRTTLWMFLLVMPVGIRVDPEHPGELTLSAHGGTGQVLSVLRDCSGSTIASESSRYIDVAASVQASHRFESGIFGFIGIRSGYLQSNARMPVRDDVSYEQSVTYSYYNPYIAVEGPYVGIGVGYLSGEIPFDFNDGSKSIPISGHLRLGNYWTGHFLCSLNENLPLASGGGYFNLGVEYPVGRRVWLFTGVSAGFYDSMGIVQKVFIRLSDRFDLDLCGNIGAAASEFAGGFAAGLRYHIPLH